MIKTNHSIISLYFINIIRNKKEDYKWVIAVVTTVLLLLTHQQILILMNTKILFVRRTSVRIILLLIK